MPGGNDTFTAAYDEAGELILKTYPNGLIATTTYDNTGNATALTYMKDTSTWLTFQRESDAAGNTARASGPQGGQDYSHDNSNRLTKVVDIAQGQCTTRSYTLDKNGNRAQLTTALSAADGSCQTSGATAVTSSYDEADRLKVSDGYAYDRLGRTLTVPATAVTGSGALSVGYFVDDTVNTLAQGSSNKTFALDPVRRLREAIDTTTSGSNSTETRRIINHYAGTGDSPSWIATSTTAGASWTWVRNLIGIDGGLVGTQTDTGLATMFLTNLHGDIIAEADGGPGAISTNSYFEQTEYGVPRATNTYNPIGYGWIGAKQRSNDSLGGLILMGVRLYNPATGRFLSLDPVSGGNANAYTYPLNPVDRYDTSGTVHVPEIELCMIEPCLQRPVYRKLTIKEIGRAAMRLALGYVARQFAGGPYTLKTEFYIPTDLGRRYADIAVFVHGNGFLYEVKANGSPYTKDQRRKDAWILEHKHWPTKLLRYNVPTTVCVKYCPGWDMA